MNYVYAIGFIILGFFIVLYPYQIVRTFGHLDWAEKYLGVGGSYTAWRLIGIGTICASFWYISYISSIF